MIQITCPYCKKEFPYENGVVDYKIHLAGKRILELNGELSKLKKIGRGKLTEKQKIQRAKMVEELASLQMEVKELKNVRKLMGVQTERLMFDSFKEIVRDRYGEKEYRSILFEVNERLEVYETKELMKTPYSKSNSRPDVISIGKI